MVIRARGTAPEASPGGAMPLMAHLRELRSRIFKAVIAILLGSVVGWIFYDQIFSFIIAPVKDVAANLQSQGYDIRLVLDGVAQPFTLQLKVAMLAGIVLASPIWIYQMWAFITPGLHRNERRYAVAFLVTAVPLFLAGVGVALWILPKGLNLLIGFTPQDVSNFLSVETYLSFLVRTVIVFGIGFLVPIFIVALNLVGVLPASALARSWRWTIIGVLIFGAVATPTGDPFSMMLLAGPMLILILVAFGIAALNDRRKRALTNEPDYESLDDEAASAIGGASPIGRPEPLDDPDSEQPGPDDE
jgi:sec-independent protein translocase protein TatC